MATSTMRCERLVATRLQLLELESRLAPGQTGVGDAFALSLLGPALAELQLNALSAAPGLHRRLASAMPSTARETSTDSSHAALTNQTPAHRRDSATVTPPISDNPSATLIHSRPPTDGGSRDTVVGPNRQTNSSFTCSGSKGLIQSETAITSYQNAVIVGYNDSRGLCNNGFQITGWAYSLDRGRTFTDGGLLPGSASLDGDPWLAAGPTGTIYMASLYNALNAVGVLRGTITPTGITWANPVVLSGVGADKEAITVDPNNGNNVYVTFTRFSGGCGIWSFRSTDAGASFSGPIAVNSGCSPQLQGSVPIVGNNGEVFVAYNQGYPNESGVGIARSVDGGLTYQNFTSIAPLSDFPAPSGMERAPAFPHIAIDRTNGPNRGHLYITYHSDHLSGVNNGDAVFTRSTDNGATWSVPTKINDDNGAGLQWFPTINVDTAGFLHSFFYDRRLNPGTSMTNLFYARSTDGGQTWEPNVRVSSQTFNMQFGTEFSTTWGDYINAETQGKSAMVAYADGRNGNPDTFFTRVANRD